MLFSLSSSENQKSIKRAKLIFIQLLVFAPQNDSVYQLVNMCKLEKSALSVSQAKAHTFLLNDILFYYYY